jgi:hypothetical protein
MHTSVNFSFTLQDACEKELHFHTSLCWKTTLGEGYHQNQLQYLGGHRHLWLNKRALRPAATKATTAVAHSPRLVDLQDLDLLEALLLDNNCIKSKQVRLETLLSTFKRQ